MKYFDFFEYKKVNFLSLCLNFFRKYSFSSNINRYFLNTKKKKINKFFIQFLWILKLFNKFINLLFQN